MAKAEARQQAKRAKYEFRVWGRHRKARKLLSRLATETTRERYVDCYVLSDDPTWNAKVRGDRFKIKRLVATDKGFERWSRSTYEPSKSTPDDITGLFEALDAERERLGGDFALTEVVSVLAEQVGVRVALVHKERRRYKVGSNRVTVTDIEVDETSEVLRTLSIEGDNLSDLVKLRKKLGLSGESNLALHRAVDPEHPGP